MAQFGLHFGLKNSPEKSTSVAFFVPRFLLLSEISEKFNELIPRKTGSKLLNVRTCKYEFIGSLGQASKNDCMIACFNFLIVERNVQTIIIKY